MILNSTKNPDKESKNTFRNIKSFKTSRIYFKKVKKTSKKQFKQALILSKNGGALPLKKKPLV
jgi:hypothetical protein